MMSYRRHARAIVVLLLSFPAPSPQIELRAPRETILEASVHVPMVVHRGMPIVEVWIDGDGPFNLAIDTGAMHPVVLDSALAKRFVKESTGTREEDEVWVDSIRVGEVVFLGVQAAVRGPLHERLPFDGILGLPLFLDVLLTLDYPAGRVRIERAELPEPDGIDILPLETHPTRLAFVELSVEGDTLSALFDTGNLAAPFYLPRSLAVRVEWASETATPRRAHTAGGQIALEEVQLAVAIQLGRFVFDRPLVVFGDKFSRAIIGGQALSRYAVSIDQKSRRLRLEQ